MSKIEPMVRINPSKVLPKELVIESIDDILYEIGLCFTSQRKHPKRTLIFKPMNEVIQEKVKRIQNKLMTEY